LTLAQKRVVTEFETNHFPALAKRVEEAAGFAVPIEVHWDTLAVPDGSHLYAELWPLVYFEPLIGALTELARDQMGRDAMKSGLKTVVMQNTKGCVYGDCWATLHDGVLTLDHESLTNANDIEARKKGLVTVLENHLS
jgi:hypothetical protein